MFFPAPQLIDLCRETRAHALQVVDAFCHTDNCIHAPIAGVQQGFSSHWAFYPRANKAKL
jgi:hypothetical protein